jgi:uncharacterized membrane protein|mmetsp:Transcript_16614/g.30218  ORF Transcript_16614/g.30218 Transcript_16614/m.30218 type:complete len:103 (-) Transcript_16614:109-417(-)
MMNKNTNNIEYEPIIGKVTPIYEAEVIQEEEDFKEHKRASGIVSGVVGTLFLGPIFGIALGIMSARSTMKNGVWGDLARSIGDLGLTIKDKAKEINNRHHFV